MCDLQFIVLVLSAELSLSVHSTPPLEFPHAACGQLRPYPNLQLPRGGTGSPFMVLCGVLHVQQRQPLACVAWCIYMRHHFM